MSAATTLEQLRTRWFGVALIVIGLDQLSKNAANKLLDLYQPVPVTSFFNWTLAYNEGAAFSFLSDAGGWQRWLFVGLALSISLFLVLRIRTLTRAHALEAWALSLILGGAIGNVIDRLVFGHVIDFVQLHYQDWYWPAFNVADSAISVGVVLLIVDVMRGNPDSP